MPPPQRLVEYTLEMLRLISWRLVTLKAWLPQRFCFFFVGLLCLVALSFFLLGGWGSPCRAFPVPLRCGFFFLWVGWVPLAAFSLWFPRVSWVGGGEFFSLLPLASCIFLSLAPRAIWSTDPQTPRPPPPFSLVRRSLTRLLLGVDGLTRRGKGRGGDRGVCDPAQLPRNYDDGCPCVLFQAGHRTPRNRLWPFRQSSSRFWGFGCFCVQHCNLG